MINFQSHYRAFTSFLHIKVSKNIGCYMKNKTIIIFFNTALSKPVCT